MSILSRLFKKKKTLRDVCVEMYGEEFGEKYDILAGGGVIGGFVTTVDFLHKVDCAKTEGTVGTLMDEEG